MKIIIENIDETKTPEMKYYAFDWDDNIVHMPTKIILKTDDGDEIGMSTEDFASYREKIGKDPFIYDGKKIVDFADNAFRNFKTEGDKTFLVDVMSANKGPAFEDFKEAINNGSIFSIITARGHNPDTLKKAVFNYIKNNWGGIDRKELVKNLKKYRTFAGEGMMSDNELIKNYLDLNKFYPVTFGAGSAESPEERKVMAMNEFVDYIKEMSAILNKRAWLKTDFGKEFTPKKPKVGFSDDDLKNIEIMKKAFRDKPDTLKTYATAGGIKKEFK